VRRDTAAFQFCTVPSEADVLVARILVKSNVLSTDALRAHLDTQEALAKVNTQKPLLEILLESKVIGPRQADSLERTMGEAEAGRVNTLLAKILEKRGIMPPTEITDALAFARKSPADRGAFVRRLEQRGRLTTEGRDNAQTELRRLEVGRYDKKILSLVKKENLVPIGTLAPILREQQDAITSGNPIAIDQLLEDRGAILPETRKALMRAVVRATLLDIPAHEILEQSRKRAGATGGNSVSPTHMPAARARTSPTTTRRTRGNPARNNDDDADEVTVCVRCGSAMDVDASTCPACNAPSARRVRPAGG
jgi:hypothetical protein